METRRKGKATIGIAIAAIMLASIFAATVPIVSAESRGDNFNHIVKQAEPQKVLIGQNLQFEGFTDIAVVCRLVSGDIENMYQADANNRLYNVNWPMSGAYYVNYDRWTKKADAQLSVEDVNMPLELRDVDTTLIVDTTGINLLPQDLVDLVIIGPDGQIKIDKMDNQTFTNITVSQLMVFGDAGLKIEGWKVGNYTFQVKTRSANACGLEAASVIMILEILKDGDFIIIQHVHNINTGENFSSIQAAIDDNDTEDGHTITVDAGTYYESVVVNKSVTLRGIGNPIVDGGGKRNVITLTAYGITLAGFNVTNSGSSWGDVGIKVTSNNNTITGNNVSNNNWGGIRLYDSSNNRITGNNICNNGGRGIRLYDSSNNTIIGNTFVNDGLSVRDSYQNTVEDNIVNGKPLVYLEDVSDYKVEDAGQVIIVNCNNITIENLDLSNTSGGIALWKTENSKISNNTVCNNNWGGIRLYDSSNNNTITGNNVSNNEEGIRLYDSSNNNTITGNNVSNNEEGIRLWDSSNNFITGNNASSNNRYGIDLYTSSNNIITCNNASNNNYDGISLDYSSNNNAITGNNVSNNNYDGISLDYSSNNNAITGNVFVNDGLLVYYSYQNIVEDNTVNGKSLVYLKDVSDYKVEDAGQVILVNCTNITVKNLDLSNTSGGIALWKTENSKISNNTVCSNNYGGISLWNSRNNRITGNNVCNNKEEGIRLFYSSNNTITGNNVCNNKEEGIRLFYSSNNTITGNNVSNNNRGGISLSWGGIGLYDSSNNNAITGNVFVNDGLFVYFSYQNTVEDNTVNGKPLVYLEVVSDYEVEDAGQVILVNCSNITVENLDLTNTSVSIALLNTENSKISNNTVCNNNWGICLSSSSNNTITGNNVSNNDEGIHLYSSSNNKIYFNNFINNTDNVDPIKSTTIWNSPLEITYTYKGTTYKSYLGNYWDDYEGTDAEGDGIGGTHYSIDSEKDESDDYPLMKLFENYILTTSAPA